jgi:hypothetical protein
MKAYAISACVHPSREGWAGVYVTPANGSTYVKNGSGVIVTFATEDAARACAGDCLAAVLNGADPQRAYVLLRERRVMKNPKTFIVSHNKGRKLSVRETEIRAADMLFRKKPN